jgi:hypothetical protein
MTVAALLAVTACNADDATTDGSTTSTGRATPTTLNLGPTVTTSKPTPTQPPEGSDVSVFPEGDIDQALQPFIVQATTDLAAQLGIDADDIEPVSAVLVTWPDASLGCPVPGMQYAQVLEDGSVIELRAGDRIYRYHSGGSRPPFPCDTPLDPVPARA